MYKSIICIICFISQENLRTHTKVFLIQINLCNLRFDQSAGLLRQGCFKPNTRIVLLYTCKEFQYQELYDVKALTFSKYFCCMAFKRVINKLTKYFINLYRPVLKHKNIKSKQKKVSISQQYVSHQFSVYQLLYCRNHKVTQDKICIGK